jgi:hypothetical protein
MLNSLKRLLLIFIAINSLSISAEVWTATNEWNEAYEEAYSTWVKDYFDLDIFIRPNIVEGFANPLIGLNPDCADTVYSARIIFAAINKLPIAFNDPTGGDLLITNKMSRWDKITDETKRLNRFLFYVFDNMGTNNLRKDTYPVSISKKTIRPGAILMTVKKNHHSWTLKKMSDEGVPYFVYSTVGQTASGPARLLLPRDTWPTASWIFEGNHTVKGGAGFRFWRNEVDITKTVEEVPGFSEEQFLIPIRSWIKSVQNTVAIRQETLHERLTRLVTVSCNALKLRAASVKEAIAFMEKNEFKCLEYRPYDDLSTPGRDRQWFIDLLKLRDAYFEWRVSAEYDVNDPLLMQLAKMFPRFDLTAQQENVELPAAVVDELSLCPVDYADETQIDLAEAKRRLFLGLLSPVPYDQVDVRWGVRARVPEDKGSTCENWDPWKPNFNESIY